MDEFIRNIQAVISSENEENYSQRYEKIMEFVRLSLDNLNLPKNIISIFDSNTKNVKEIIRLYYQGKIKSAFEKFNEATLSNDDDSFLPYCTIKDGSSYYRVRKFDDATMPTDYTDLFHVPFEKRNVIGVNRFSIAGYPALYVCDSVEGAYKEVYDYGQTSGDYWAARIEYKGPKDAYIIDMRINKKIANKSEFIKHIVMLPYIIASALEVQDEESNKFKPEYLIPQIFLHSIFNEGKVIKEARRRIKDFKKTKFIGIAYSSTKKNDAINYVFPAMDILDEKSKGYSKRLCKMFWITDPICIKGNNFQHTQQKLLGLVLNEIKN